MRSANTLVLGILLAAAAPGLYAQAKPTAAAGAKSTPAAAAKPQAAPQAAKPAAKPAAKSAPSAAAKPQAAPQAAKPASKPVAKSAGKKAAKVAAKAAAPAAAPAEGEAKQARRDPFESLVGRQQAQAQAAKNLPPGKAGLQVESLRLDGIVRAPNGMIAVVTNPQSRTYFLREGDQLFDGRVEKIAMDGVSFHELGKDAFGKPVERQVNKRIYSSVGEQQ
jgi:Tfp pilus assembly protein PilP